MFVIVGIENVAFFAFRNCVGYNFVKYDALHELKKNNHEGLNLN
jgi:hypothetical protein